MAPNRKELTAAWAGTTTLLSVGQEIVETQLSSLESLSDLLLDIDEHFRSRLQSDSPEAAYAASCEYMVCLQKFTDTAPLEPAPKQELCGSMSLLHLFHLLYLSKAKDTLAVALARWYQAFFSKFIYASFHQTTSKEWTPILRILLLGLVTKSHTMLSNADTTWSNTDEADAILELVCVVPVFTRRSASTVQFLDNLENWKAKVGLFYDGLPVGGAKTAAGILVGDMDSMASVAGNWLELMIGYLLFKDPTASPRDLGRIIDECQARILASQAKEQISPYLECFELVLRGSPEQALAIYHESTRRSWFSAIFADLLWTLDILPRDFKLKQGCSIREYYLTEYGCDLSGSTTLWKLAESYFAECPAYGSQFLSSICLCRPRPTDEELTHLFRIAHQYALHNVIQELTTRKGMDHLEGEEYPQALVCFLEAGQRKHVNWLVQHLIQQCGSSALTKETRAMFSNVGRVLATRSSEVEHWNDLIFLDMMSKYCKTGMQDKLLWLLSSGTAPVRARRLLLEELLHVPLQYTAAQVLVMLEAFEGMKEANASPEMRKSILDMYVSCLRRHILVK